MKKLLGIVLMLASTTAFAQRDFWGYEILSCSPASVATPAQRNDGNNRIQVAATNEFYCTYNDREFLLELSEITLGLKITGPQAEYAISFRCRYNSDFEGDYNFISLAAGLGYAGAIGQASKIGRDERDCLVGVTGYEILQVGVTGGRISITEL